MIRHFIIEEPSAPDGKMPVLIVTVERSEFLDAIDQLRNRQWHGRAIFYDGHGRGGVDLMITPSSAPSAPYELRMSRSVTWGPPQNLSGLVLAEEVRNAFAAHPLTESAKQPADEGETVRVSPATNPLPQRRSEFGQMALF